MYHVMWVTGKKCLKALELDCFNFYSFMNSSWKRHVVGEWRWRLLIGSMEYKTFHIFLSYGVKANDL